MQSPDLHKEAELLKAVAHENRLRILGCLLVRPACVCELMDATGLYQPCVSRHLRILRHLGLVRDQREAQWVVYSVPRFPKGSA
ncbi:MAG: winged helix-turn-helix transcriptional regulator, partial [Armatimonadetes bacterium]|nr:winged helix-turn-helix transcriptional regulator [Armatimonadota bacterium]